MILPMLAGGFLFEELKLLYRDSTDNLYELDFLIFYDICVLYFLYLRAY